MFFKDVEFAWKRKGGVQGRWNRGARGNANPPSQTQMLTLWQIMQCLLNYVLKGNSALFTQDSFFAFLIFIDSIKIHKFVFILFDTKAKSSSSLLLTYLR